MGNVQSLVNKTAELCANARYLSNFRKASILSFTETWLTNSHLDFPFELDGFKFVRAWRKLEKRVEVESAYMSAITGVIQIMYLSESYPALDIDPAILFTPRILAYPVLYCIYTRQVYCQAR